eukprot:COSAG05_NODE_11847_length_493_cov_1.213198_1_plen_32_part_10
MVRGLHGSWGEMGYNQPTPFTHGTNMIGRALS